MKKQKKILITLITLIIIIPISPLFLNAQENVIFEEYFEDNRNEWVETEDENMMTKIQNGKFIFEHKREESSYYTWNFIDIDQDKDFIIETTMKHLNGLDNFGYGLVWGLKDIDNYFSFEISDNGYYRITKTENSDWEALVDWTEPSYVHTYGGTNKLSIKKSGNQLKFYINDNYVNQTPFKRFFGNAIGYVIWKNQAIEIDNLKITEITSEEVQISETPEIGTEVEEFKHIEITGDEPPYIEGLSNPGFVFEKDEISIRAPDGWRLEEVSCTTNDLFPNDYFISKPDSERQDLYTLEFSYINNKTVVGKLTYGKPSEEGKYVSTETLLEDYLKKIKSWYFTELTNVHKSKIKIAGIEADRVFFKFDSPGWSDGAGGRTYTCHYKGWGYFFKTDNYLYSITALSYYKPAEDIDYILCWLLKGISFNDEEESKYMIIKDRGISIKTEDKVDMKTSDNTLFFLTNEDKKSGDLNYYIFCYWNPDYRFIPFPPTQGDFIGWINDAWDYIIDLGNKYGWTNYNKEEITFRRKDGYLFTCDADNDFDFYEIHFWHNDIPYSIRAKTKKGFLDFEKIEKIIKLRQFDYDLPIMSTSDPHLGNIITHVMPGFSNHYDRTYDDE
ncbi:MAG: hypothetical protein H8D22_13205 [Candidatus Cloacimonetes bacterium]|nr:hypothetical protein [Candidatus Cloacimonadota bacterium]